MIYTSHYYSGKIKGRAIGISLYPPRDFKGQYLQLLAPTREIFRFWKSSACDEEAWDEYKKQYKALLISRWPDVKQWLVSLSAEEDMTLLCYKETYCHRHLVGLLIEKHRPELWGGETK